MGGYPLITETQFTRARVACVDQKAGEMTPGYYVESGDILHVISVDDSENGVTFKWYEIANSDLHQMEVPVDLQMRRMLLP